MLSVVVVSRANSSGSGIDYWHSKSSFLALLFTSKLIFSSIPIRSESDPCLWEKKMFVDLFSRCLKISGWSICIRLILMFLISGTCDRREDVISCLISFLRKDHWISFWPRRESAVSRRVVSRSFYRVVSEFSPCASWCDSQIDKCHCCSIHGRFMPSVVNRSVLSLILAIDVPPFLSCWWWSLDRPNIASDRWCQGWSLVRNRFTHISHSFFTSIARPGLLTFTFPFTRPLNVLSNVIICCLFSLVHSWEAILTQASSSSFQMFTSDTNSRSTNDIFSCKLIAFLPRSTITFSIEIDSWLVSFFFALSFSLVDSPAH